MKKFLLAAVVVPFLVGFAHADGNIAIRIDITKDGQLLDTAQSKTRFDTKEACEAYLNTDVAKANIEELRRYVMEAAGADLAAPRCEPATE